MQSSPSNDETDDSSYPPWLQIRKGRKLRILIFSDGWPPYSKGGAETVAWNLARQYALANPDVGVLTTVREGPSPYRSKFDDIVGVRFEIPVRYPKLLRPYLSLWYPRVTRAIEQVLDAVQPDCVHAHNVHRYLGYQSLSACWRRRIPVVATLHDAMSVDYGRFVQGYESEPKDSHARVDYRVRLWPTLKKYHLQYFPLRNSRIRRVLLRRVSRLIAQSEELARLLRANGLRVDEVVRCGLEPETYLEGLPQDETWRAILGARVDTPIVALSGRLIEDKGCFQALQVIEAVRKMGVDVTLLILGALAGDNARFDAAVSAMGLDENVVYAGWLDTVALRSAYQQCDVVLVPSICLDVFPTVVLEAMACGVPVVATSFGGAKEAVEHGKTGYIVSPFNIEAMARRVYDLLMQPNRAKAMGAAGQEVIQGSLHIGVAAKTYLARLRQVVEERVQ